MTRREFIQSVLKATSAIVIGAYVIADKSRTLNIFNKTIVRDKASPRKFIRAVRQKKYPGGIKPLSDINTQGKWRG
jgi:hypothetical protein